MPVANGSAVRRCALVGAGIVLLAAAFIAPPARAQSPNVCEYDSIQAALDANPGRMVFVPAGDHVIEKKIVINQSGGGMFGPDRIIQHAIADQ